MFRSATRTILFMMTISLIAMCAYTLVYTTQELFEKVFVVFVQGFTGVLGYFIAKSVQDGKENTASTTISQDVKPLQTPEKGA